MTDWTYEAELAASTDVNCDSDGAVQRFNAAAEEIEYDPTQFELDEYTEDLEDETDEPHTYGLIGNTTATQYRNLPQHLRRWGLKVVEVVNGWQHNGRPYDFSPVAVVCHHTASNKNSGNFGSKSIVINGRSDLPGPLAQILLGRNGDVIVVTGGRANHAGAGGPAGHMYRGDGNTQSFGIEAENDGIGEPWSKAQMNAYYRLCAALLNIMGRTDVSRVIGHKEWTPQKIDPDFNMDAFRRNVHKALHHGSSVKTVHLSRLKPGKRNSDVLLVKHALTKHGFSRNDNKSKYFGKAVRDDYRHWQFHLGYRGSDADGIPGKTSLEKLGFRVVP